MSSTVDKLIQKEDSEDTKDKQCKKKKMPVPTEETNHIIKEQGNIPVKVIL